MAQPDALLLQMGIDSSKMVKQGERAGQIAEGTAKGIENRFRAMNDNVNKSFAGLDFAKAAAGISALGPASIAATAAVGALIGVMERVKVAAQYADDLAAAATRIGVTAEALQELRHAAEANDIAIPDLDKALQELNGTIGALQTNVGAGKLKKAFAEIGIGPDQLRSINTADQLLPLLADKISKLGTQAAQVQIARKLGIEALLPLLQTGADGVAKFTKQARDLHLVLSEQTIQSAADLNEQMRIADEKVKNANTALALSLVPTLAKVKSAFAEAATAAAGFFEWMDRHSDSNPDFQIDQKVLQVQSLYKRAQAVRSGFVGAATTGLMPGATALNPQKRETEALRLEADAARLQLDLEKLVDARSAALGTRPPVPKAGPVTPLAEGAGGKVKAEHVGPRPEDIDAQFQLNVAMAAGNKKLIEQLQDEEKARSRIKEYIEAGLTATEAQARVSEQTDQVGKARQLAQAAEDWKNHLKDIIPAHEVLEPVATTLAKMAEDAAYWANKDLETQLDLADLAGDSARVKELRDIIQLRKDALEGEAHGLSPDEAKSNAIAQAAAKDGAKAIGDLRTNFHDAIRDGFSSALEGGNFGKSIMERLAQSFRDKMAAGLADLTTGLIFGSASTGSKGFLGSLLGNAGGLLGALPHFAAGTSSAPGGLSLVGERGPELVNLPRGASVIPNSALGAMRPVAQGSMAPVVHQTVLFDNRGAVIWEDAQVKLQQYADNAAARAGFMSYQGARKDIPASMAKSASSRLGR